MAETVRQLMGIGLAASQIFVYERFQNQLDEVNYAPHLPPGVQIVAAERANQNVDTVPTSRYVFRSPFSREDIE